MDAKITAIGLMLVEGLLNGIIDAVVGMGKWLWDNLCAPIIDWMKEPFGIHSPSTVFAEIGVYVVEGFLGGIKDTWHAVTDFLTGAVSKLSGIFDTIKSWGGKRAIWRG